MNTQTDECDKQQERSNVTMVSWKVEVYESVSWSDTKENKSRQARVSQSVMMTAEIMIKGSF